MPTSEQTNSGCKPLNGEERNVKPITIALVLCAIPATAFAQSVFCDDCGHIVPYYKGNGGLVGMMADGADEVTFVASCYNVTTTGTAGVSDDGMASMLFNEMNGLACADMDGGSMEIAGLEDGAWYWITDDVNSAVGSLVNKAVLGNDMTMPADTGSDDIVMTPGEGAYFLKQVSTGRVGILSTIMAAPPADPVAMCGSYKAADGSVPQTTTNCMLGDGSTWIELLGPERRGAPRAEITDGTVERDFSGDITVEARLWTSGGTVSTFADDVGYGYAGLGDPIELAAFTVELTGGAPNEDAADAGLSSSIEDFKVGSITISDGTSEGYCTAEASYSVTVDITARANPLDLLPAPREIAPGVDASTQLTINCPSAEANVGRELVPDSPFPSDK